MDELLFFELGSAFDDLSKIFVALDLIVEDDRDFINMKNDIVKMCTDGLAPSTVDDLNKKYDDLSKIFVALDLIVEDDRDFINMKNDIVKMCTDGLAPSTVDDLNKKYAENIRKTIFKYKKIILEYLEANECNLVPYLCPDGYGCLN